MESKKIKVNIAGNTYTIIGEKSEKEVFKIASFLDKKILEISEKNYRLNQAMAVTLASLNITSDFFDLKKELELINKNTDYPMEKQEELLKEKENLKNEKNILEKEIEVLKSQNAILIETIKNIDKKNGILEKNSIDAFNDSKLKNNTIIKLKDDIIKIKDEYIKKLQKK